MKLISAVLTVVFALRMASAATFSSGDYKYERVADALGDYARITDYTGADFPHSISIPGMIGGFPVRVIGRYAFSNTWIQEVTLPDSVEVVEVGAFNMNFDLEGFTVASGNQFYKTVQGVLFTKDGARLVKFPIGKDLSEYEVPSNVRVIEEGAFFHALLERVNLPQSLEIIGDYAFSYCAGLQAIFIPENVSEIGSGAFASCYSLPEFGVFEDNLAYRAINGLLYSKDGTMLVDCPPAHSGIDGHLAIPEGTVTVGESVFRFCNLLDVLVFPKSLQTVHADSFDSVYLDVVVFLGNAPRVAGSGSIDYDLSETQVFHSASATGFAASPFGSDNLNPVDLKEHPAGLWLAGYGLDATADPSHLLGVDGLPVLFAFAFGADPRHPFQQALPKPEISNGFLTIKFGEPNTRVRYIPEASLGGMSEWHIDHLTSDETDSSGNRIAALRIESDSGFLRLRISLD